jgi:hypothetical protein
VAEVTVFGAFVINRLSLLWLLLLLLFNYSCCSCALVATVTAHFFVSGYLHFLLSLLFNCIIVAIATVRNHA